ncbi:MAG: 50S ribosomal protein L9 [Chloroflexi bacterium]|nr:50S ribosomal protein L9 [Chloroflexota bacterium]
MRVILLEDVDKLGHAGDVVEVKNGFARNYLIPRGLAQPATRGLLRQVDQIRKAAEQRRARELGQAESIAAVLKDTVLEFRARAGENNRLYGSITKADIAEAIHEKTGIEIDRRNIQLDHPLRQLGEYQVPIRLMAGVVTQVVVRVANEAGEIPTLPEWEEAEGTAEEAVEASAQETSGEPEAHAAEETGDEEETASEAA